MSRRPSRPAAPGAVRHDGRPMRYAHGEPAAYTVDGCRCDECVRTGTWLDPTVARGQLADLRAGGVRSEFIAAALRVDDMTLRRLATGGAPRVRVRQAEAIAAIHAAWRAGLLPEAATARPVTVTSVSAMIRRARATGWHAQAACIDKPPAWFHPVTSLSTMRAENRALYQRALDTCARCPVTGRCYDEHHHEAYGVWGGTTPGDRRDARRRARLAEVRAS